MTINANRQTADTSHLPTPSQLEQIATQSLEDDKAFDIVTIDLAGKSSLADVMLIASGNSARQVSAMAEHLVEKIKASGVKSVRLEGKAASDWVLIDAGDIIVHLFRPEVREFYNIEKMWLLDAPASQGNASGDQSARNVVGA
ncbi:MAG: ribosome silencing factor [Pseudomonadota bacterium]